MDYKFAPFRVKEAGPDDGLKEGQFAGYASVFGNVDSYGDIVDPGAFTRTLAEWAERGGTIPVLWGHDMHDPFANIGGVIEAVEDEHGLKVVAELDLENPTAAQVYRLIKGRRTNTMSFAYAVKGYQDAEDGMHLTDLDLFEVSVVQVPANELAEITAVKQASAALAKAGRVLSAKNETALREARDAIDSVLSSLSDGEDQEKASGEPEAKPDASDEEPGEAKSSASGEEPKVGPSVEDLAAKYHYDAIAYGEDGVLL